MQASRFHPRLQYRPLDGGSQTFGAGTGSRTGSGRSFWRIVPQGLDARGEGIPGIVDGAAKLLGESLGFSVGKFKVHDPDMGSLVPVAKARAGLPIVGSFGRDDRLAVGNLWPSGVFSFAKCRLILAPTRRGDRDAH